MSSVTNETKSASKNLIQIDEHQIRSHVREVVRSSVEETLNGLLDAEADQLCGGKKYERTDARRDTRAGSYERKLQTQAEEVKLTPSPESSASTDLSLSPKTSSRFCESLD